jgi:hypothetical protein
MKAPRKRAQAIARGRGRDLRVTIPFAFDVAARISARPRDEFRTDATQLANGLLELHRAIDADGIVCAAADRMEFDASADGVLDLEAITGSGRVAASLEACRRLRATLGDDVALLAALTGPATLAAQFTTDLEHAGSAFVTMTKTFCDAGVDVVLAVESDLPGDKAAWESALRTADNVTKFHRGALLLWEPAGPYPSPVRVPLERPAPGHTGFITTAEPVPADADIDLLRRWVEVVAS